MGIFPNAEPSTKKKDKAELVSDTPPGKIEQHQPAELITPGFRCGFDIINAQTSTLSLNCITELTFKENKETGRKEAIITAQSKCIPIQSMIDHKSKLLVRLPIKYFACIDKHRSFGF